MGVQIQTATKDGEGNSLSILNRQFISFSYGGKNIEDFNLLAVFSNDRLEKEAYTSFTDITTKVEELDGQMFWRSVYNAGSLSFTLATDGMTEKELKLFKQWFIPGVERELILSEHHNRGILARVSSAPRLSILPFEKDTEITLGGETYKTKTSLYKGEIILDFVMDSPYWYAIKSSFTNDELSNPEILKIIHEDGVPCPAMFDGNFDCLLGKGWQYSKEKKIFIEIEDYGIELLEDKIYYIYYPGSAEEVPILRFTVRPVFEQDTGKVFFKKGNDFTEEGHLFLGDNVLKFSLPNFYRDYNLALDIVFDFLKNSNNSSILELRKILRDSLTNYYILTYVMGLIDNIRSQNIGVELGDIISNRDMIKAFFIGRMKNFINIPDGDYDSSNEQVQYANFNLNLKRGQIFFTTSIKPLGASGVLNIKENAGDMIKTKYLIIEGNSNSSENLTIRKEDCLELKSNINLLGFYLDYNYKYL